MKKDFVKGQLYRPAAKVAKVKKGEPTVLIIRGQRYILDHKDRGRGK